MSNVLHGVTRPSLGKQVAMDNPKCHGTPALANRTRLQVVGPDGEVKQTTPWVYNIMNTFGLASLASRLGTPATNNDSNVTNELVVRIAIGTGTNAATSTDTQLVSSVASLHITQGLGFFTKANISARLCEYQATFQSSNPAGPAQINEVALHCGTAASGNLFARAVLGANSVNKGNSDQINLSYDIILVSA